MRSHALGPQRKGTSCLAQEENCTRTVDTFSSWNNTAVYAVGLLGLPPVATSVAMVKEAARPFPTVSVPDHANYTIGAVILIIGIIGLVGNFLVIYAFSRSRALRTPANLFIINLAIVDFLMCATQSPVFFTASMNKRWIFGEKGCELYAFCGALFGICSMITLMVIAVDRYFVITRPLASIGALSQKRALWVLACAWTYSAGWSLPPFFGWSAYVPEGLLTSCTWDYMTFTPSVRAYTMLLFIFVFFIPLIVIIYCYFFIFRAIRRTKQGVGEISGSNTQASVKSSSRLQSEWRMAKVALIAILLYVVSWSPYSSVALMAFAGYGDMLTPYMKTVPAVIAKASAIHNPIIYAITHPKYRKVIAESIPCLGVLLRVPKRELLSLHSQLSSAHFAITRHASDMSGTFPCSRIVKFHLSPMSNSESAWTYHPQGWTDTEADVAGRSLQPASQQTYCSVNNGPAKLTDLTPCSSSSFRSRHKTLDSGIFEKQAGGSIDGTLSRGDTGCITSKIYGSKSTSILTSMRCNVYSQGSTGTIGKGSASRESPDGVQQGAVFHSTAAEMPTSCHPEASLPH